MWQAWRNYELSRTVYWKKRRWRGSGYRHFFLMYGPRCCNNLIPVFATLMRSRSGHGKMQIEWIQHGDAWLLIYSPLHLPVVTLMESIAAQLNAVVLNIKRKIICIIQMKHNKSIIYTVNYTHKNIIFLILDNFPRLNQYFIIQN